MDILIFLFTDLILSFRKAETTFPNIAIPRIVIPISFKNSIGLTESLNCNSNLSVQIVSKIVNKIKLTKTIIKYFKDFFEVRTYLNSKFEFQVFPSLLENTLTHFVLLFGIIKRNV